MSISKGIVASRAIMAVDGDKLGVPAGYRFVKGNEPHSRERTKRSPWSYRQLIPSLCLVLALSYFICHDVHLDRLLRRRGFDQRSTTTVSQPEVLEVFQVYPPVVVNGDSSNEGDCTMLLMEHSFGYSYGKPFVGNYTPPSCKFNRVVMNFTVTSRGRQFDRLALMYLSDIEVWRTSTAEPTAAGIQWTYIKDMTPYLSLWQQSQKVIFDLGNLIDDTYTGAFNTTLTLTFLNSPNPDAAPASLILPLSARRSSSNGASVFSLPAEKAITTLSLPRNAHRATISLSACGQADEEFWWSNVFTSATDTFTDTTGALPGFSPWREVQVYVDDRLAGVQWPFPVVFTGGIVPGLWRPIVGIEAFDLREYEVDVSPWLGLLSDGEAHTFEIKVAGIADAGDGSGSISETVGNSWLVTGKLFLWLDEPGHITTGTSIIASEDVFKVEPELATTHNAAGANETLFMNLTVHRELAFTSTLTTASGTRVASWSQQLSYTNRNDLSVYGVAQFTNLTRSANDSLTMDSQASGPGAQYSFVVDSEYHVDPTNAKNLRINATSSCEVDYLTGGGSVFLASGIVGADSVSGRVRSRQVGKASYVSSNGTSSGTGATKQVFLLEELGWKAPMKVYSRDVGAAGGVVVWDRESGGSDENERMETTEMVGVEKVVRSVREALGRGPGRSRKVLVMGGDGGE